MAQLVISIDPRPTQLNRPISAGDTTLQVISTAGFASEGVLSLGQQEIVEYTGITSNTFTGVTRGQYDTDARSFNLGTLVYSAHWVATETDVAAREASLSARIATHSRVTGSNVTRTAQTLANITGLSLDLTANSVYEVQAYLSVASSSTAGNGYALQFSGAGASVEGQITGTLAAATQKTVRLSTFGTSTTFVTVASNGGIAITAIVTTGANAGALTVQHLKVTSGTATVYTNSFIKAVKLA